VKKDFLKEPGANGQNALQGAVCNPTPRRFGPGVCPAAGSSSWHRLSVSWHKVLVQYFIFKWPCIVTSFL
jgi:hypothetical protein